MNVEVFLTSNNVTEQDVQDRVVVVVDVLRTSTTIASALKNGARAVVPAADMGEASGLALALDPASYLLGGERGGRTIEGYRFGNSPHEYRTDVVAGKTLILNTTNGTPAIRRSRSAAHLLVGAFVNADQVVDFLRDRNMDLVIVCAGWRNRVSLEDTLCAGMLLDRIWDGVEPDNTTDASHISFTLYQKDREDILAAVRRSRHGSRLAAMGREEDVEICGSVNTVPILPYYRDSRLTAYGSSTG